MQATCGVDFIDLQVAFMAEVSCAVLTLRDIFIASFMQANHCIPGSVNSHQHPLEFRTPCH